MAGNATATAVDALISNARAAQAVYEAEGSQARYDRAAQAAAWAIMEPVRNRELAELAERGVDGETAQIALDDEAPDFDAIAEDWYRRKYRDRAPKDFRERAQRAQALYRRGFESEQIRVLTGS